VTQGQLTGQGPPSRLRGAAHGIPVAGVLRRYDLPGVADTGTLCPEPVSEGLLNRGLRLTGPNGSYYLKQYLDDVGHASGAVIAAQHRAIAALRDRELPTAPPLAARDGRSFVLVRGRRYALFPWVDGAHRTGRSLDHGQCRALGALLGRLHLSLDAVLPAVVQPVGVPSADPVDTERTIDQLLRHITRRAVPEPFDELAAQRLHERRGLLAAYGHRRPRAEGAPPTGWVHGDFHPMNLLYRGGEPVAVLDWDRLGAKPRAEEVVRAATLIFHHPETGVLDLPRLRSYARAYRTTTGIGPEEIAAGVHRVWWERLNDFWMLRWRYQRRDERADPLFPAAAAQTVWWCAEYEQVLDAFVN
jgi:Ser/Thr protein kinase RdoA (MazF antagonist)